MAFDGPQQFLEADDRGQRRRLDQLHEEADHRRPGDRECLRQDHQPQFLEIMQPQACAGVPLAARQRVDAAAPYLARDRRWRRRSARARPPSMARCAARASAGRRTSGTAASAAACPGTARCSRARNAAASSCLDMRSSRMAMPTSAPPTNAAIDSSTVQRVAKQQIADDVPERELDHDTPADNVRRPTATSSRRSPIDRPR